MPELLHIAAFWLVVVVIIRIAVCFPDSVLARILFSRHGPLPIRDESKAEYLLRCARFRGSWFAQAAFLFAGGWVALGWDPSLADSLSFLVSWAVVIPSLGALALLGSLSALASWFWLRYCADVARWLPYFRWRRAGRPGVQIRTRRFPES